MRRRHLSTLIALGAAVTLGLSACGGDTNEPAPDNDQQGAPAYGAAITGVVNKSTKTGGTVKFAHSDDFDSPDPGDTYYAYSWNFSRLYARTLMAFKPVPGEQGLEVTPDLAEAPGQPSDGGKTWTYKLRQGVKFDDGSPVTSKDVKYAVMRSNWAKDVLPNGPNYFAQYIDAEGYRGPYKDKNKDVANIETPDDQTIVFKLNTPFSEMDYLVTSPQTSPVPQARDKGAQYKLAMASTGPFKVDSYEPGKQMVLSANPNWDQASDPIRKRYVDRIEVQFKVTANDLDQRLLRGDIHLDLGGTGVQVPTQSQILTDEARKANADNVISGFLRFIAINQHVEPLDNLDCRKAVQYAVDKVAMQTAHGGPIAGGDIATTVLPPNILGHQKFDLYPSGPDNKGDLAKAKEHLTACGQPNGFSTKLIARSDRPKEVAAAEAIQQALDRVGIKVEIKQVPAGNYFANFGGVPNYVNNNGIGLISGAWAADWPSGLGFLQQIIDGRAIKPAGNSNLAQINEPEINALFDQALATTDANARNTFYAQIDKKVMEGAYIIPQVYAKGLLYRNPALANVFVTQAYTMYDYTQLGLK